MQTAPRDQWLVATVITLISIGIIMVYSATVVGDRNTLNTNSGGLIKHVLHIILGFLSLIIVFFIRIEWLQAASKIMLLGGLMMLALLVFVPDLGVEVNGSLRWFDFGGIRFQPAELVKIIALIYFADYFARKRDCLHLFQVGIINVSLVIGLLSLLLLMEPDFGTTVVIFTTVAGMMFLAGVRLWHFAISISVAVTLMTILIWIEPYRMARFLSYRDPWSDPFGSGFQLSQALIAIGRGEWFGTGLGSSIQKLFYLPHASNDFLIAIIGEELGAIGILTILALFGVLLYRAFVIANRAFSQCQQFSGYLAQGIGLLMMLQASVHIGVNTGLLPTKGITLPLMSHGGSSMLSSMLSIGILLAIDRQNCLPRRTVACPVY